MSILCLLVVLIASCRTKQLTTTQFQAYINAKNSYIQGDFDKSAEILDNEAFTVRQGHQALLLRAKCDFFRNDPKKAQDILQRLIRAYPGYTDAQIWLVRSFLAQEKFDEAKRTIETALEFNGDDPRLLQLMASIHESKEDYQKAFDYYSRTTLFADELGKAEISLAQLYYHFKQNDNALIHIKRAQSMVSDDNPLRRPLSALEKRISEETNDE